MSLHRIEIICQLMQSLVKEINRFKVKTYYELVNLRINLEETKNENSWLKYELSTTENKETF